MTIGDDQIFSQDSQFAYPLELALEQTLTELANERTLTVELGALRMMLLRLLAEEGDVGKLSGYVARVASVAIQAVKTHNALTINNDDTLLTQFLKHTADLSSSPSKKEET